MTDPNQPHTPPGHGGPPGAPPPPGAYGAPPPGGQGWGPPGAQPWGPPTPGQQFAQPAAQPYYGGHYGPEWIPELGMQAASVGARIGAKAIDIVFYVLIQIALGVAAFAVLWSSSSVDGSFGSGTTFGWGTGASLVAIIAVALVGLAVDFLYNVFTVARFGGQPGKLLLGLRVVRADGQPMDWGVAFRRWSPILALVVLGFIPIGDLVSSLLRFVLLVTNLVLVASDDRHRSVFDRVGGTYVVTTR